MTAKRKTLTALLAELREKTPDTMLSVGAAVLVLEAILEDYERHDSGADALDERIEALGERLDERIDRAFEALESNARDVTDLERRAGNLEDDVSRLERDK